MDGNGIEGYPRTLNAIRVIHEVIPAPAGS
jgi:hypothetical protein